MSDAYFRPALFTFLRELAAHNERDWFAANKERYERDVRQPMLRFITDLALPLARVAPEAVADPRPSGGSMFRIHRDVRFSADKSPYKTAVTAQFRYRGGKNVHVPGYYLHIEPGNVVAAAGIWRPERDALARIRQAILDQPKAWSRLTGAKAIRDNYSFEGESLKRPPSGVAADHPLIEDLKRKDFAIFTKLTQKAVTADDFLERYLGICRETRPFVDFLARALAG